jgi:hypothetical protein
MAKKSPRKPKAEKPISIRLIELRAKFDKRVALSGLGQNDLIRLAVEELLAKYQTPEATIAAMIRSRTAAMKEAA